MFKIELIPSLGFYRFNLLQALNLSNPSRFIAAVIANSGGAST